MKKIICVSIVLLIALSSVFAGCSPTYDKSPDQYNNVTWYAPDYSFKFTTSDDCKGMYKFGDIKYNIKVSFDGSWVTATDTDKNKELFNADWTYNDENCLYIYNITFNTKDYKELKDNYAEYVTLNKEKA